MSVMKKAAAPHLTADKLLGVAGSSLAVASIGFGLYMNTHGPAPGGFGAGHNFTVFAQLAPRAQRNEPRRAARPATTDDSLDTTATASIAKGAGAPPNGEGLDIAAETNIIPSVTLEAASADAATIAIDGRMRTVRVGDDVPGAGEVLVIETGARPRIKTSRGLILAAPPS